MADEPDTDGGQPADRPRDGSGAAYGEDLTDVARVVGQTTALLCIAAGMIHFSAAGDDTVLPALMAAFVVLGTLQVGLGALLLWRRPTRPLAALGVAMMFGAFAAWLLCRIVALPLPDNAAMEPIGFKDGVAVILELASVPGLLFLASGGTAGIELPSPRLGVRTLTVTAVAVFALLVPAVVLEGGGHHPAGGFRPAEDHHEHESRNAPRDRLPPAGPASLARAGAGSAARSHGRAAASGPAPQCSRRWRTPAIPRTPRSAAQPDDAACAHRRSLSESSPRAYGSWG